MRSIGYSLHLAWCFISCFLVHFVNSELVYSISESTRPNHLIGNIFRDSDLTSTTGVKYEILDKGSPPADFFKVSKRSGKLRLAQSIDRDNLCEQISECCESILECQLRITVRADSSGDISRRIIVGIIIVDINDNAPGFPQREIIGHIPEYASIGYPVAFDRETSLLATDRDGGENGQMSYKLVPSDVPFAVEIDRILNRIMSLSIVTSQKLDRELVSQYTMALIATDGGNPSLSGSVDVTILIDDLNDNAPVFNKGTFSVHVPENMKVGSSILQVTATDPDEGDNGAVNYSIL